MLFNASHPTIQSCVAPNLLDTYIRYKQDTRAIITWLMSQGGSKNGRLQVVSIRDLLDLADNIKRKAVVMPETIDFHFREAIAARTQLSKLFRRENTTGTVDPETVNHEYFTTR